MRGWKTIVMILPVIGFALLPVLGCRGSSQEDISAAAETKPSFLANMAFFYYRDLDAAVEFYSEVLGLPMVLDYGFAKAFRLSFSSFICLVDETGGMHDTTEPKTVTLAVITGEVDAWYDYLNSKAVPIVSPLGNASRHPTRGFVALDPEGYYLEFETFLDDSQNSALLEKLDRLPAFYPKGGSSPSRPEELGIKGTVFWLYYHDIDQAQAFYQNHLGRSLLVDQGFSRVMDSSPSGFIGLVDQAQGLHRFSEKKSVNIGFFTREVETWYRDLTEAGLKMRGPLDNAEGEKVRAFVTFDPAGYYLEFDQFLPHEDNRMLLDILDSLD